MRITKLDALVTIIFRLNFVELTQVIAEVRKHHVSLFSSA